MRRFGVLKSVVHNMAHSLASGVGLSIGYYTTDIFGDAQRSPKGIVVVDFLSGAVVEGLSTRRLVKALALYRRALSNLCVRHGCDAAEFKTLLARFGVDRIHGCWFSTTVEDHRGRRSVDLFHGYAGRRISTRR